jgi:hypothetical protein
VDVSLSEADLEKGEVHVTLTAVPKATVTAAGDYAFEILSGTRVVSAPSRQHSLAVAVPSTVTFRAADYFLLEERYVESVGDLSFTAPPLGRLNIELAPVLESCRVSVRGPKTANGREFTRDLGFQPLPEVSMVPGRYTVALECPGKPGPVKTAMVFARQPTLVTIR